MTRYSLDPENKHGGAEKAKKFKDILNFEKDDWQKVKKQVMDFLPYAEAIRNKSDERGERFNVYIPVTGKHGRMADVMSAWIYDRDKKTGEVSETPRLINCFIDGKGQIEKWEH